MKLSDFAKASESDRRELKRQIDALPPLKTLVFDGCALPRGCVPARAAVGFYKDAALYAVYLNPAVRYAGRDPAMNALKDGEPVLFKDFEAMCRLFEESLRETEPDAIRIGAPPPGDCDPIPAADPDGAVLSEEKAQTTPDCASIKRELEKSVIGQDTAVETVAYMTALHLKKHSPKRPLSIVAYGPPGTGKSETAKSLAKALSKLGPHEYADVWTDLNQFAEAHSVYRLIGSPPGYVGYDDKPVFEAVTRNPHTVFIFDELDKAHPEVLKVFMAVLDEGRCAARKEQADHSREYDFRRCIFIFTSNHRLGKASLKRVGFSVSEDIKDIRSAAGGIEVDYAGSEPADKRADLTKRIYRDTEAARKAFVEAGALAEIAGRFNCFVEFKELDAEAKVRILAKQVIETGFEYNIRLTRISSLVLRSLIDASASEKALTVRSFKVVIEGYLAAAFAEAGMRSGGQSVRLEGTLETPVLAPN